MPSWQWVRMDRPEVGGRVTHVDAQPDLVEGIRAQLVDKDRSPRWNPAPGQELPADLLDQAYGFTPPTPLWG